MEEDEIFQQLSKFGVFPVSGEQLVMLGITIAFQSALNHTLEASADFVMIAKTIAERPEIAERMGIDRRSLHRLVVKLMNANIFTMESVLNTSNPELVPYQQGAIEDLRVERDKFVTWYTQS